jgi:hypothetical protein
MFIISRVVIFFWVYGNWKHNFLILFVYYIIIILWGVSSDSEYQIRTFSCHSPRALSLREAEFFQGIQGIGARLLENPKFISWTQICARLGKSQVQGPITCPLVDELMICNWIIYIWVL